MSAIIAQDRDGQAVKFLTQHVSGYPAWDKASETLSVQVLTVGGSNALHVFQGHTAKLVLSKILNGVLDIMEDGDRKRPLAVYGNFTPEGVPGTFLLHQDASNWSVKNAESGAIWVYHNGSAYLTYVEEDIMAGLIAWAAEE